MTSEELKAAALLHLEYYLGVVAGKCIFWGGKLALKRGDNHEFHHAVAALTFGNSGNCGENHENCMIIDHSEEEMVDFEPLDTNLTELGLDNWIN